MIGDPTLYAWPGLEVAVATFREKLHHACRAQSLALSGAANGQEFFSPDAFPAGRIGQICAGPFAAATGARFAPVARPHYNLPGCPPGMYRAVLIVAAGHTASCLDDVHAECAAINSPCSFTGCTSLMWMLAERSRAEDLPFPTMVHTGGHHASLTAVAEGRADVASIDAVCWELAQRLTPELAAAVRPLAWGPCAPSPPFVIDARGDQGTAERARLALSTVLEEARSNPQTTSTDRTNTWASALGLTGFSGAVRSDYLSCDALRPPRAYQ